MVHSRGECIDQKACESGKRIKQSERPSGNPTRTKVGRVATRRVRVVGLWQIPVVRWWRHWRSHPSRRGQGGEQSGFEVRIWQIDLGFFKKFLLYYSPTAFLGGELANICQLKEHWYRLTGSLLMKDGRIRVSCVCKWMLEVAIEGVN